MSHHLVETVGLSYNYPDGTAALSGISFRITHGESVGIIGANGAGKSTLLLHLNGCLLPTAGHVRIGGEEVTPATLREIRRAVGLVFQNPDDQLFMPTVREDVAFGPSNLGFTGKELENRVAESLKQTGVFHLVDRHPYRLSGGEKKRVAIAAVLAMAPDILVMDEPTSGLDPHTRRQLIDLIHLFHHTRIITSHDLDMISEVCQRVIVLKEGMIVADGPAQEVFSDRLLLEDCHLEQPLRLRACPNCGVLPC